MCDWSEALVCQLTGLREALVCQVNLRKAFLPHQITKSVISHGTEILISPRRCAENQCANAKNLCVTFITFFFLAEIYKMTTLVFYIA